MKNLWIPNIFIYNLKSFRTIDVLSKLAGLWIDAKKRIYYSQATHITFICKPEHPRPSMISNGSLHIIQVRWCLTLFH